MTIVGALVLGLAKSMLYCAQHDFFLFILLMFIYYMATGFVWVMENLEIHGI